MSARLSTRSLLTILLTSTALAGPALAHDPDAPERGRELFQPGVEHAAGMVAPAPAGPPRLYAGLGDLTMPVTTQVPQAQAYFDQGLRLAWGFNHAEARRAFREAQRLDPTCALCFWGEAWVLGPNINDGMREAAVGPAQAALARALTLSARAGAKERALIAALAERYAADGRDRTALDQAYARAMARVAGEFPDDAHIQTLTAEAMMTVQPWDYWQADGRTPKGLGGDIVAALERALALDPNHPAAAHLYIHAVEASAEPERAEPVADRLRGALPAAGHLVHMPAHIYMRLGRYADSIAVNRDAVAADEAYLAEAGAAASPLYRYGYYPHNVHFLLVSAQMAGLRADVVAAAEKLAGITSEALGEELAWTQAIQTAPFTAHAQFSSPETILALADPGDRLPFVKGVWHYARGIAHARAGDAAAARGEVAALKMLTADPRLDALEAQYLPARGVLELAMHVVEARIEQAAGDLPAAVHHLHAAIALQERLPYMEPPYWYYPVRQTLGAVRLQQGRPDEAAAEFRRALAKSPGNGWAIWGLAEAQRALGAGDLAETEARLAEAWLGPRDLLTLDRL